MFIKADGFVARVAPSDSYCLAIERMGMDGVLALRLTVSGETRTIYAGSNDDKELYPFLLEEIDRFHEAFMAENLAIKSGQQLPASDTVFTFRDFYETNGAKK